VTEKTFFQRLSGLRQFTTFVAMLLAPTPPPLTQQLFLDFCEISCGMAHQFFTVHQVIWPKSVPSFHHDFDLNIVMEMTFRFR